MTNSNIQSKAIKKKRKKKPPVLQADGPAK